ncbi:MAG: 3-deoxy-8-phosphooctulonate synthase [Desulfuromonadaceae bacterium]|nr:3-deoxy-8-phosphooctulonate synthase [Desulfuromonas sp.]MDY0184676.1 3-deoxy-8-phosphooctulonate synthase [Desulfuromonadaceae bacterium]
MQVNKVQVGNVTLGGNGSFVLIAGPCVLEDLEKTRSIAAALVGVCSRLGIGLVFKGSYDKANRTSVDSFRGPGIEAGLEILARIKDEFSVPVLSDVHAVTEIKLAADVLDIIQIPAFLCRQTDLLVAAGASGKVVNVKKGQFQAPWDMQHVVDKIRSTGNEHIVLTERGASFGYNNLVVDMRSLPIMRNIGCPVVFDATHAVQLPGGAGGHSGGQREYVAALSRAAVAVGVDGLFWEVYDDPDKARCDGPNSLYLRDLEAMLQPLLDIDRVVKKDA